MWQQNNNLKHIFYNMTEKLQVSTWLMVHVRETFALCSTKSYRSLIELWKKSVIARLFYLNNSSLFLCTQNPVTFNCKPLQCYRYRLHFNQKWSIQDLKYWSQWSDISSTNAFQWQSGCTVIITTNGHKESIWNVKVHTLESNQSKARNWGFGLSVCTHLHLSIAFLFDSSTSKMCFTFSLST